ncbi:MAG: TrbC/VirB2 family protein [Patescibacteria group bacterium]|nr:TrbC/VirB2 family protein [Patescibacteria group bacterium]
MSKLTKNLISLGVMAMVICLPLISSAQLNTYNVGYIPDVGLGTDTDVEATAQRIINLVLGFLGFVALVIIIIAGFKWMTSGGNDEKIGSAKKMMGAGVVGLIIVLFAYVITAFVFNAMATATNTEFEVGEQ